MEKVEESTDNGDDLNVHHNTYKRRGHELGSDLLVLCQKCHKKIHNKK